MARYARFTALLLFAACAKGQAEGDGGDDQADVPDAAIGVLPDAANVGAPDAADVGGPVTLTQSNSMAVEDGNSIACYNDFLGYTLQNSFYRVFDLAAEGVAGPLTVSSVKVGIESALSGNGNGQPMRVKLHTLSGPFVLSNLTEIANVLQQVEDQDLKVVDVPVSAFVPAGATLVVEVFVPSGENNTNLLFPGSNDDGQTGPTYVRATSCDIPQPTDVSTISGGETMHLVLAVNGDEG